ncbi:MAG: hypothetical protein SFV55_00240 [Haliscomenobacter sp.]|uniref:hypothetical protein n=1 Tax=Haliscomenobacter sp. TaxID=2717303 RepID=UPI0029AED065|nr:hypothetical protein [Haliscomenobacter sp.]MDX2066815.1 hypothetical protein [Haliscomenobacter sp.]
MHPIKYRPGILPFLLFISVGLMFSFQSKPQREKEGSKPKIAFTFDDGSINDFGGYKLETWNQRLLDNLSKHQQIGALSQAPYYWIFYSEDMNCHVL